MHSMARSASSRRGFCRGALATGILAGALLPLRMGLAQPAPVKAPLTLAEVNRMDEAAFVAAFGDTYELSPWVAKAAFAKRPFATVTALHQALADAFRAAPREQQLAFFRKLSDIGDRTVKAENVTVASKQEQAVSGVDSLSEADHERLKKLNKAYRDKFDISFTIANRRNTQDTIFTQFERRLGNDLATELATAIQEEFFITRLRIAEQVIGEGMPRVYGDLTVHALNSVVGRPASGMAVELFAMSGDKGRKVAQATSNTDGRADVLVGRPLPIGRYELRFAVADYFRKQGTALGNPPFLDVVPVRLYFDNPEGSYHVPMVCSPWSYAVYR
jgi:2-oxo-4-hydroxy-4-carboxy-5-ureidoimidazoline decarboxylase